MENIMIGTMPIKPYKEIGFGLIISPLLCDILGNAIK